MLDLKRYCSFSSASAECAPMQKLNAQIDHGPILQAAFGFWSSKVLLTAVEFGLFTTQ